MVNPIPNFAKNIWSKWNIRVVVLTSFCLQIILYFLATSRKRSRSNILVMLLWSTYLIADCTAIFCIGLISTKYGDKSSPILDVEDFLIAFWAPFLLLHLGGPDTITAFALEDNELWLRHLLGLIVQVCLTSYVFLLTLPVNTLWLPTSLVLLAGIIKFGERTRSLQLASTNNFRQSKFREPDRGSNYAKLMEEFKFRIDAGLPTKVVNISEIFYDEENDNAKEPTQRGDDFVASKPQERVAITDQEGKGNDLSDEKVMREAYGFFTMFKGIVVDMIFSFEERNQSRSFFRKLTALDALRVIEVELNFFYDAFYTKASVLCTNIGFWCRFVSFGSVVAALVIFVRDQKRGCEDFDVKITYTLLYGAVALDVVSLFMLMISNYSFASIYSFAAGKMNASAGGCPGRSKLASILGLFLKLKRPKWIEKEVKNPTWFKNRKHKILCRFPLFRRWSESISGFNLISCCLQKMKRWERVYNVFDYVGAKDLVEQLRYEEKQPLLQELWIFIFKELERKSKDADDFETIQIICSSRGELALQESVLLLKDVDNLKPFVEHNKVTFDQCVILWHIATDLLFYEGEEVDDKQESNKNDDQDVEKGRVNHPAQNLDPDAKLQRDFSKLLSDYMLYLLIMQPTMMFSVRGIAEIRFQDTCAEATYFFSTRGMKMMEEEEEKKSKQYKRALSTLTSKWSIILNQLLDIGKDTCKKSYESIKKFILTKNENPQPKACKKLMDVCVDFEPSAVKGGSSESLLFDACRLAHRLNSEAEMNKWKVIAKVWVELLSYAAANCTPITHVQQLSKGGEFVSFVWLLMTHLGMAKQFQIKEGPRTKMVLGETEN
ncbi:hypothetical protein VNO78_27567 [Psophocarpus tetragonolobus]|uniref:DUF4220 domain-containing protein n=1 Tax=Psophocarpus tetragonolobus TaxID=3891 RepID=A0AAN9XAS1_PSOTE